jgi:hypothetical protein
MFARFASLLVVGLLAGPALADPPKKTDPTADILAKLRGPWKGVGDTGEISVDDFVTKLSAAYDLPVVVDEAKFKLDGFDPVGREMLKLPKAKGLTLRAALRLSLAHTGFTFLVRRDHIEFVTNAKAAMELKVGSLLAVPVNGYSVGMEGVVAVSMIVKEKPLNEVVADIAEEFDLNVVVAPQAGDSRMAFVSLRLLNVPADKALDVIATAADLRVVRKGNVFLVTSRDHAKELFDEKLDKERQKIEVQKQREAPANPFGPLTPTAPPVPKPEEKK